MNKKLQVLLDKISFNKEYYDDFKSSKIDKIVVKEDSNTLYIYMLDNFVNKKRQLTLLFSRFAAFSARCLGPRSPYSLLTWSSGGSAREVLLAQKQPPSHH